jgi:hypothetical protein
MRLFYCFFRYAKNLRLYFQEYARTVGGYCVSTDGNKNEEYTSGKSDCNDDNNLIDNMVRFNQNDDHTTNNNCNDDNDNDNDNKKNHNNDNTNIKSEILENQDNTDYEDKWSHFRSFFIWLDSPSVLTQNLPEITSCPR